MKLVFMNDHFSIPGVLDNWKPAAIINEEIRNPVIIESQGDGKYCIHFDCVDWYWQVTEKEERILIKSQIRNTSDEDLSLGNFTILDSDSGILSDADSVRALGLADRGQNPRYVLDVTDPEAKEVSQLKFQFYSLDKGIALQIGFISFRRLVTWVKRRVENGHICGFTAYACFGGWVLKKETSTDFEEFTIACGKSPFAELEEWADLAADRINPEFCKEPSLGLTAGGWTYRSGGKVSFEELLIKNMDAVNERLKGYGFKYVWVSQTNIPGGNLGDWFGWNYKNMPGGPEYYVSICEERGFLAGLWNGGFLISGKLKDLVNEYWDALYKEPDGSPTVFIKGWRHGDAGSLVRNERPDVYGLDASHPKARKFISDVFAYWKEKGIRYYMIDFIRAGAGDMDGAPTYSHADKSQVKGAESFCGFMEAIRKATGKDTYILTSSGPTFQCSGYVDAVRTGCDLGETRAIKPDTFFYPASLIIKQPEFWTNAGRALYNMASYYTHRKLYLNDIGNVLTISSPIPFEEARINATVHGMSGCASMLEDSIYDLPPERLALIKKSLPRHKEQARPEDLFTHKKGFPPRIYRYDFEDSAVMAVYNLSNTTEKHTLSFDGDFAAWEFWTEEFLCTGRDQLEVEIHGGTVRIFHFVRRKKYPFLLANDFHMLMGELDTTAKWEDGTLKLSIKRPGPFEQGCLYVYIPKGYYVLNPETCRIVKVGCDDPVVKAVSKVTGEVIAAVPCITDENGNWNGEVKFARYDTGDDDTSETEDEKFQ